MLEDTQPNRPLGEFQRLPPRPAAHRAHGCLYRLVTAFAFLAFVAVVLTYFLAPIRTNILLLGTDDSPERGTVGRTDTMILTTIVPTGPYVGMLSIPRDLWVNVPGIGEQRINTAYFFAESTAPGAGAPAAMHTVETNFGVPVDYYAIIHMPGVVEAVDALEGVDVNLREPMAGLVAGPYHLTGEQALIFLRDRSDSDDFSRMERAHILIAAMIGKTLRPDHLQSLPRLAAALPHILQTDIPLWQWPRLGLALLRAAWSRDEGLHNQTITREMVTPFETPGGAQVLAPNWTSIRPVLEEMFDS